MSNTSQITPPQEGTTVRRLWDMEVGESFTEPISRYPSLKATASSYSIAWGRKYQASANSRKGIVTVTRIK